MGVTSVEDAGRRVWRYTTSGLAPARAELTLGVLAEPGEEHAPTEPLDFLDQSFETVLETAPIEPFHIVPLAPQLLGFDAAAVARSRTGGGEHELVLLTGEEAAVAREQGLSRVLAALEEYPNPAGALRGRLSRVSLGSTARSILAGGAIRIPGIFALLGEKAIELVVLEEARERLGDLLTHAPSGSAAVLATEAHPRAECWLGGAPHERRGSAAFVAVLPEKTRDTAELVEDGLLLSLTGATWSQLRVALVAGDDLELALSSGETLLLDWRDAWSDLTGVAPAPAREIRIRQCLVFGSDEDVAERVGREPLDAFIRVTLEAARAGLAAHVAFAHGLKVQGMLRPPLGCSWLVTRPAGERGQLDLLLEHLSRLRAPRSTETVVFELTLEVVTS